jgi:predicted RNA-binding Zn ribbon-like protein
MERKSLNAYAEEIDGLVLPAPLGGHPALDFCNTRAGWGDAEPGEYLRSYVHLAVWAAGAGLVDDEVTTRLREGARRDTRSAREALARALEFRTALYSVLLRPQPGPAWRSVAFEAESATEASALRPGEPHGRWIIPELVGPVLPVFAVALKAADLLTSDDLAGVRACPGTGCGWLFLDRAGRRRWCTMATCGNRAKARRFSERTRGSAMAANPVRTERTRSRPA